MGTVCHFVLLALLVVNVLVATSENGIGFLHKTSTKKRVMPWMCLERCDFDSSQFVFSFDFVLWVCCFVSVAVGGVQRGGLSGVYGVLVFVFGFLFP